MAATGHESAIRSLKRGLDLRGSTLQALCRELNLEFYVGPPRGDLPRAASGGPAPPFDTFSAEIDLPVRGWAKCSLFGHLEDEQTFSDLPMPVGIRERDAEAFYAIAAGPSMVPEGIGPGDYCLVSPNTPLAAGMRVWLKDRQGRACIKRLLAEDGASYSLRGWQPPDDRGRQAAYDDQWMKSSVAERGAVLAVYRDRPDATEPPGVIADPRAPAAAGPPPIPLPDLERTAQSLVRLTSDAGGDPIPEDLRPALVERWGIGAPASGLADLGLADPSALAVGAVNEDGMPPGARPVDVHGLRAAAGGGALVEGEEVRSQAWFRRDWLDRHGLDPTRCLIVDVAGGSMEPVLPDGCSVLVDRNRRRRYVGRIYLARTDEGLVVKRAGKDGGGGWLLTSESDAPEHAPIPWPADVETIGEVRWMAASFP